MRALLALVVVLLWSSLALAQPALDTDVKLSGGAAFKLPAGLKDVRTSDALVVREQAADPATKKPFLIVLVSVEKGPPLAAEDSSATRVPWEVVRQNIKKAAETNGREVTLQVDKDGLVVPGMSESRRIFGELTQAGAAGAPKRTVGIELVALVKDEKLVTVGVISESSESAMARELALAIAKTTKL